MAQPISIPEHIEYLPDIAFATGGGRPLRLDMMRPRSRTGPIPVILHMHGGGWRTGSYKNSKVTLPFAERGFATIDVEYRHLDEAPAPAQIEDCKAAVRWLRANADEYGFDAERIGALGESAGGRLAALIGLSDGVPELEGQGGWESYSARVHAVVAMSGAHDPVLKNDWSTSLHRYMYQRLKHHGYVGDADFESFRAIFDPAYHNPVDSDEVLRLINPLTHVRVGAPPFLIIHGEVDMNVPIYQGVMLAEALRRVDADVTFLPVKNTAHSFSKTVDGQPNSHLLPQIISFFAKHLLDS
ncbi:MAG: Carboxylesterase type [Paenibacillus sp.]|jgi:acetyl esterase/lipase|nr:Carboxylesterase type [Paenibacillus sp.]